MDLKYIGILLLFGPLCLNIQAQKHPQFQYISIDAGANMAGISSGGYFDKHQKNFGLNFCLSGNYSLNENHSLGAGLAFEQKGAVDRVFDINSNLNYFTLPVYFKYSTRGQISRSFFSAGAYASHIINARRVGTEYAGGDIRQVNEVVTANFRSFDYGLTLGAGLMIRLYDKIDFMATIRGSAGLMNIDRNSGNSFRNYHFNAGIGYIYYIGFR
jgi:hypothetical protein